MAQYDLSSVSQDLHGRKGSLDSLKLSFARSMGIVTLASVKS